MIYILNTCNVHTAHIQHVQHSAGNKYWMPSIQLLAGCPLQGPSDDVPPSAAVSESPRKVFPSFCMEYGIVPVCAN